MTKNEILYSLNKPEDFILAIVEFAGENQRVHYVRQPFQREPDFGVTSVNYDFAKLIAQPKTKAIAGRSGFRDPDNVARPSEVITRIIPEFQKVSGARWMAAHLSREGNSSRSFQVFLRSLELVKGKIKGDN